MIHIIGKSYKLNNQNNIISTIRNSILFKKIPTPETYQALGYKIFKAYLYQSTVLFQASIPPTRL